MQPIKLNRRRFLRASGVTLALPWLEGLQPRLRGAEPESPRRLICICSGGGFHAESFFPVRPGRDYPLSKYLEPLRDFRNDFTVVSGLSHPEVDGGHASENCFLTAAPHPGQPSFTNSISLDQFAIAHLSPDTRVSGLAFTTMTGNSLSHTPSGVMIPGDSQPSVVFRRLFVAGNAQEVQQQVERLRTGQSVMDSVRDEARQLSQTLGSSDRARLDDYLTSVREVEIRLRKAEAWTHKPKPKIDEPPPTDNTDYTDVIGRSQLLYDLAHLALRTDSTRFVTIAVMGHNSVPPIPGISVDWHSLQHHGLDPAKIAQLQIIELEQMKIFAALLGRLKQSQEAGQTLLDRTIVLHGSNLGSGSSHDTRNLPILIAGGGFKHGQYLAFDKDKNTPLCNLYLSILHRLGVDVPAFASSRGTLRGLEVM